MEIHFEQLMWAVEQLSCEPPVDRASVERGLCEQGLTPEAAGSLVDSIAGNMLLPALKAKTHTIENREWALLTLAKMQRLGDETLREFTRAPRFTAFMRDFYTVNRPCVFRKGVKRWPIASLTPDKMLEIAGDAEVEIMAGRTQVENCEAEKDRLRASVPFSEYYRSVMGNQTGNDLYMTAENHHKNRAVFASALAGIKDFSNGYMDPQQKDTACIWFGPGGTHTTLHYDSGNNILVQIYGRKRVYLVSPLYAPLLYNTRLCFSPVNLMEPDLERMPLARHVRPYVIELAPGDAVFIPTGWWHQIYAHDISISVNMTHFKVDNSSVQPGVVGTRTVLP